MPSKSTKSTPAPSYQEVRLQLDDILLRLQNPDSDVDEAVSLYEAALKLITELEHHLETAENRITTIQASL